jgi:hypothetical protein
MTFKSRRLRRLRQKQPLIHWQVLLGFLLVVVPVSAWVIHANQDNIKIFLDIDHL